MLEEVLRHLNNWFLVPDGIHSGEFIVQDGGSRCPFCKMGSISGWWGRSLTMGSTSTRRMT